MPSTQPVVPSASRTCRQLSNSLMISTGRPARRNTQAVGYSVPGPWRRLTRSDFRLTKRGTGRPLAPACGRRGVACAARPRQPRQASASASAHADAQRGAPIRAQRHVRGSLMPCPKHDLATADQARRMPGGGIGDAGMPAPSPFCHRRGHLLDRAQSCLTALAQRGAPGRLPASPHRARAAMPTSPRSPSSSSRASCPTRSRRACASCSTRASTSTTSR